MTTKTELQRLVTEVKGAFFEWLPFASVEVKLSEYLTKAKASTDPDLERVQEEIAKATVANPIHGRFPCHPKSSSQFFKRLVIMLECMNVEVREEFYTASLATIAEEDKDKCFYKSYFTDDDEHMCSLQETREFISKGTTGLTTWPAARFLLKWMIDHRRDLNDKELKMLELGSGVGFTGISLAKLGIAQHVILSDCHPSVIQTLEANVTANFQDEAGRCSVAKLDWESFDKEQASKMSLDFILVLGADVVFDTSVIPFLVKTIDICLERPSCQCCLIACVERNVETREAFEKQLLENSTLTFDLQRFEDQSMLLYTIKKKT